jgi:hypothetical protein
MNGHHGFCFSPSCGSPFFVSASIPLITSSSIVHNSQLSNNWSLDPLHCMHHHPDIDSFPRAMAWNAKSPVRHTSTFGVVLLFPTGTVRLNLHWSRPCSSVSIWRGNVATTLRPMVSRGSIVCLISFAVSLWHISSQLAY